MTDKNNLEVEQIGLIDLSALPKFTRSRKGGYVEEEIDKFLRDFVSNTNGLIERYNSATAQVAALARHNQELEAAAAAPVEETPVEVETEADEPEIIEEETSNTEALRAQVEEAHQEAAQIRQDAADRARRILADIQETATRHFSEAQEEARDLVEKAQAKATAVAKNAEDKAEELVAAAESEVADFRARVADELAVASNARDKAVEDAKEIIRRLRGLHSEQLSSLEEAEAGIDGVAPADETRSAENSVATDVEASDLGSSSTTEVAVDEDESEQK